MNVVSLARFQFAATIMFHYLFPPLTIGIGVVLVYLEAQYLRTRLAVYETAARFWTQLFAATFAMGVATGIVMEFEFGTNWSVYSRFVGDVFGSALAAEGIFAFFLESGFLAVLIFGWDKVSPAFHFFAALMVSLGSMFSAVWIIVANSWQQTPAGHHIVQMTRDGQPWFDAAGHPVMRAELVDYWAVVFNPSTVDRLIHTLIGAFILGAFFIMSISAYYLLRRRHEDFARRSFSGALVFATVFSLAQAVSGDFNARMVAHEQPDKLAAFEGHFTTGPGDLSIFGWPDVDIRQTRFKIAIPGLLSFLVHGDSHAAVTGLDEVPRQYWPPVLVAFLTYHAMVGIGCFFIGLTLFAALLRVRKTLFAKRWLLWIFVFTVLPAIAANELGWMAAEVGRQPWVVHPRILRDDEGNPLLNQHGFIQYRIEEGLLTSKAVSEAVDSAQVLSSIIMFGVAYTLLLAIWITVLTHKIHVGPIPVQLPARTTAPGLAAAAAAMVSHADSMSHPRDEPGASGPSRASEDQR
jgi:cytochrome d ubiquinol oxidase subunit I